MTIQPGRAAFGPWPAVACATLVALACVNALLFAAAAANPLIVSDGWHFLDLIVRPYAAGEFEFADLFVKRSGLDHSQPLRKLILLMHYELFALDYSVEAIIGVLAAMINLGLFWHVARRSRNGPFDWQWAVLFAALAAVYLSLNSATIFSWPLLTLNYTSHLFVLVFLLATWRAVQAPGPAALMVAFLAALAMGLVADDTAAIATVATVLTIAIGAFREGRWRAACAVAAVVVSAHVAYQWLYQAITSAPSAVAGEGLGLEGMLGGLIAQASEAWRWVAVPLGASVAHRQQVEGLLGEAFPSVSMIIAAILALAHAWFWWQALRGRRNLAAFVATGLMLLFYGLLAGMIIARVSLHGSEYLWQPRYVLIYEWNLVALLLMALAQARAGERERRPRMATAAAGVLLLLQLPLSIYSWDTVRYIENFRQRQAEQMAALARDPSAPPKCAPVMTVCRFPEERRAALMAFLADNRLNLFSQDFRKRHGLEVGDATPGPAD